MLIKTKVENKQYEKLIDYASKKCDAVMFVARKDGFDQKQIKLLDKTFSDLKKELKNNFIKSRNGSYWVHTKVGNKQLGLTHFKDPYNFDDLFKVEFYRIDSTTKKYLLTNKNMYNWLNPKYPEDLSFFSKGYCWLYSVAHEEICYIYCENEIEYEYLKSIGIEFVDDKYIPTKREDLYYEKYGVN